MEEFMENPMGKPAEKSMENTNSYEKPVTLKNIVKFAVPTIAMTVFMSFYTMVDGLFVSNLIGTDALSAINLTAPVIQLVTAISTMLATGGSAVIMKKMGAQKTEEAKEDFTFLIMVNVIVGIVMCVAGYLAMDSVFAGMNLSADVEGYCVEYLSRYLVFTVPILLMNNFTLYMIASEKAALSLICSVAGGVLNMALDYVFIAILGWGTAGAALATSAGFLCATIYYIVCMLHRTSRGNRLIPLTLTRFSPNAAMVRSVVSIGIPGALITVLMSVSNIVLNNYISIYGSDAVASYGIAYKLDIIPILLSVGLSQGVAPLVGY